jgi:single-strand DNA-binding protein
MIDALVSGKLIEDTELKSDPSGKPDCNFLLTVSVEEPKPIILKGITFGEAAE